MWDILQDGPFGPFIQSPKIIIFFKQVGWVVLSATQESKETQPNAMSKPRLDPVLNK